MCVTTLSLHDALPIWPRWYGAHCYADAGQFHWPPIARLPTQKTLRTAPPHRRRQRRFAEPFAVPEESEEHTSELQSRGHLVCRLLLEKKKSPPIARAT